MIDLLMKLQSASPEAWLTLISSLTGAIIATVVALVTVWLTNRSGNQRLIMSFGTNVTSINKKIKNCDTKNSMLSRENTLMV